MGIASVVVLKQSSFRRHLGAVCQWGRLSCKDPAGTTRCVVFTGRLRTFKKNTKMQGLSRLGVQKQEPQLSRSLLKIPICQPLQLDTILEQSHCPLPGLLFPGLLIAELK